MPRESTRQPGRQDAAGSHMEMKIRQTDTAAWVALSGILDRDGVMRLIDRVTPHLSRRGTRVVLDGRRLTHLDYRATRLLVDWNRRLGAFNHQLYLHRWSDYLKAILVMEDWDRELGNTPDTIANWRRFGGASPESMP